VSSDLLVGDSVQYIYGHEHLYLLLTYLYLGFLYFQLRLMALFLIRLDRQF